MTKELIQELFITEFAGRPPDILIWDEVDTSELEKGDDDPLYVTLKVMEVNAISRNGRQYPGSIVQSIQEQLREKRPTANSGHIRDEDRPYVFPVPAGYWVGATLEGQFLWAKAYLPNDVQFREVVRRLKATNSKIATSIYGTGTQMWDEDREMWVVTEFDLEHIDFAPADRAGIASLGMVPVLTSEMVGDDPPGDDVIEEEDMPEKLDILKELTVADVQFLPKAIQEAIVAESEAATVLAELRTLLGDDVKIVPTVQSLKEQVMKLRQQGIEDAVTAEIDNQVLADAKLTDRVKRACAMVARVVEMPETSEGAKAAVEKAVTLEDVQAYLKDVVQIEMGPNIERQTGNRKQSSGDDDGEKFFIIPETKDDNA